MNKETIQKLINDARKSRVQPLVTAYQAVMAGIQERENRENITLTEDQILGVIKKERDAYTENSENTRTVAESLEMLTKADFLSDLLPAMINENAYDGIASEYITKLSATSMRDMGKVAAAIKEEFGMQVDMKKMSGIVKTTLMSF